MFRAFLIILLPILISSTSKTPSLLFTNKSPFKNLTRRDYVGFTCWISCADRATVLCFYFGQKDTGNASRPTTFTYDPKVNKTCQQLTSAAYSHGYDRGHMVSANHMDASNITIKESMYISNIMPQTSILNKQAWLEAEEIFECYRDKDNLMTIVGIIMGNNTENDIFVKSHGVKTPDFYWRIIQKQNGEVISWIMPNTAEAKRANLNKYLARIKEIEDRSGFIFKGFTVKQKKYLANVSWPLPFKCKKS